MHWSDTTHSIIRHLHDDDRYTAWNDAVKDDVINTFSKDLDNLLLRLSNIIIGEMEVDPREQERLIKVLELAAVGGMTVFAEPEKKDKNP